MNYFARVHTHVLVFVLNTKTNYTHKKKNPGKQSKDTYLCLPEKWFAFLLSSGWIFYCFYHKKNRRNEILKCTLQVEYIELGIRCSLAKKVDYENLQDASIDIGSSVII